MIRLSMLINNSMLFLIRLIIILNDGKSLFICVNIVIMLLRLFIKLRGIIYTSTTNKNNLNAPTAIKNSKQTVM